MAFREKLAWVQMSTILVGYVAYLSIVFSIASVDNWRLPVWAIVPPLIGMGVLTAVLAAAGSTAIAVLAPRDALAAADERDRQIGRTASARAYVVAVLGVAAILSAMLFGAPPLLVAHLLVSLFVMTEVLRYASEGLSYRRGSS